MINLETVIKKLEDKDSDNIVCCEFQLKTEKLAEYMEKIQKCNDEGYIIIGVKKNKNSYVVNGFARSFNINIVIEAAKNKLKYRPNVESKMFLVEGKNICVIAVKRSGDYRATEVKEDNSAIESQDQKILDDLYSACLRLQRNSHFNNVSEDERNDYIRDLLEIKGYSVKDQTRQGKSYNGKKSGEIDLLIQDKKGFPITIIEALILKSLDVNYLDKHIDKIYMYDTLGNKFNFIISYVIVKEFETFLKKYTEHIKKYQYPYKLINVNEEIGNKYPYSDIRVLVTEHNRNGTNTLLYHICVKIQK